MRGTLWEGRGQYLCCKGHASGDEKTALGDAGGHHAIFLGLNEAVELLDLGFDAGLILVLRLVSVTSSARLIPPGEMRGSYGSAGCPEAMVTGL